MQPQPNSAHPMIDHSLITATPEESRVLFADDLGSQNEKDIRPIFERYGVMEIAARQSQLRTFGYLTFPDHESAQRALADCNYTKINGKPVHLYWADEQTKALKQERKNTVILKGIDPNIDIKSLHKNIESQMGEVINVTLHTRTTPPQVTNAYLQFRHLADAEKFVSSSPIQINGVQIQLEMYIMQNLDVRVTTNEDSYTKIYFNSLPESYVNEQKIRELIGDRATITEVRPVGQQAALVTLANHEEAVRCVTELNRQQVEGKPIEVSRALTKSEFNQRHQQQQRGRGQYHRGGFQPRGGFDRGQGMDRRGGFRPRPDFRNGPRSDPSVPPK